MVTGFFIFEKVKKTLLFYKIMLDICKTLGYTIFNRWGNGKQTKTRKGNKMKTQKVKFFWNGIKVNGGKLNRAHYSDSKLINHPEGTFTIYARDYSGVPTIPGLAIHNDTDTMTDYFEKDRIRVAPDNPFYSQVEEAFDKQEAHREKRWAKKYGN